jgi:hypothetical protein
MGAINHDRLDGEDPSIVASGHTVFDLGVAKQLNRPNPRHAGIPIKLTAVAGITLRFGGK